MASDPSFFPVETERLLLRPPTADDAVRVSELTTDLEIVRFLARVPYPNTPEQVASYIATCTDRFEAGGELLFLICLKESGLAVGMLSLRVDETMREAEIGYWIGKAYWGQGLMSEAVTTVANLGMEKLDLKRIHATAAPQNVASLRILRKAGLVEYKRGRIKTPARDWDEQEVIYLQRFAVHPVLLVAAVALVDRDGRVLLAQRPEGKSMAGLWEFPGGKVDPGETPEAALIRELKEELAVDTEESCLAPFTFASHSYDDFHLLMPLYVCRVWKGIPQPLEGQTLAWARPNEMKNYPMPPADKPLVAMLRDLL